MALTSVLAGDRQRLGNTAGALAWQVQDALLPAASCVAIVAMLLARRRWHTTTRCSRAVSVHQ
jgi:hypothetical protein